MKGEAMLGTKLTRLVIALALVAGIAGATGAAGCTTTVVSAPSSGQTLNTVSATGSGQVTAAPDMATMSFGATSHSGNAKTALANVSSSSSKIVSAIKKAGIADKDIQTQNVSVYPETNTGSNGRTTVTGYQASISVTAKVRDLGSLGDVIDAASAAGADTVNGPSFGFADDSAHRDQAAQKAIDDARKSASAMAKAAGRGLGGIVSVTSGGAPSPIQTFDSALAAGSAKGVSIQPGQLTVSSDVTVVFQLR
jgi:uncharacterized protein